MQLEQHINTIVKNAFLSAGYSVESELIICKSKSDLFGDLSTSYALSIAKTYKKNPRDIALNVSKHLEQKKEFEFIKIEGAGYINLKLNKEFLIESLQEMLRDKHFLCKTTPLNIVIDYGGPNIAKPLHVGHLRAAIIGEALKRIALFNGHTVKGDIHMGDWGLQIGMLINELKHMHPTWSYFSDKESEFPSESPFTNEDLLDLYPKASQKAKKDEKYLEECRNITSELQKKHPGFTAIWKHIVQVSIKDLKTEYDFLDVYFDLWLGESDADKYISEIVERFQKEGYAHESDGALIVDVAEENDSHNVPPVIMKKRDGAILYHATDIATIFQRILDFDPDLILYVVDKRQSLHFEQVFRCVKKTKIASEKLKLEHIAFGTMNGKDGKPFKTRDGGILRLRDLMNLVTQKAKERLEKGGYVDDFDPSEKAKIARSVGLAALKFGDLNNICRRDYIFDIDKFLAFEGKTGPYLLYSVVRAKSILSKAQAKPSKITSYKTEQERKLIISLIDFPKVCQQAFKEREPKVLCEYGYILANTFSSLYANVPILNEENPEHKQNLLATIFGFTKIMATLLNLLGIPVPDRM